MAIAETIGDHTTCMTISAIMGPPPLNKREVQAVANYVETELWLIDQSRAAKDSLRSSPAYLTTAAATWSMRSPAMPRAPRETLLASTNAIYHELTEKLDQLEAD